MAASGIEILPPRDTRSQPRRKPYSRLLIFSSSFLLKAVLGALFFGSVDVVNSATNSLALLAGEQVHLPYLPTINAFLWFGGVLSAVLPVALPLSVKLVPILFDSLLAVLIYDLVRRSEPRLALRAGMLYALNPVAILIAGFHGQWDAIALFFLLLAFGFLAYHPNDPRTQFLFGAVFGVSLLIKPIGLPFLLLFPERTGGRRSTYWPVMGLGAVLGIAFGIFWSHGYSLLDSLILIFCYSAKGAQEFGLPFSPLLAQFNIQFYRLYWIVPAIVGMGHLYRKRRLTAMDAMLLFYLYCMATTGISPQYLLWPLPLLIVTKRFRLAALYTAIGTAFLLLFYSNPWASYFSSENLGIFAPMRGSSWLLPPAALESRELLQVVHALGNVVIPACAMVLGAFVLNGRRRERGQARTGIDVFWTRSSLTWYFLPPFLLFATILACKIFARVNELHARLAELWKAVPSAYGLHIQWIDPRIIVTRDSAGQSSLNIVLLLGLFAAIWCGFAARASDRPPYMASSAGTGGVAGDD